MNDRPIIKKANSGFVGHDGNGMVGGSWGSCTHLFYKRCDIGDILEDDTAYGWLYAKLDGETEIILEAYFDEGYDNSVGISHYCDMDECFVPDEFLALVEECPFLLDETKEAIEKKVYEIAEDDNGYEAYECDDEPDPCDYYED